MMFRCSARSGRAVAARGGGDPAARATGSLPPDSPPRRIGLRAGPPVAARERMICHAIGRWGTGHSRLPLGTCGRRSPHASRRAPAYRPSTSPGNDGVGPITFQLWFDDGPGKHAADGPEGRAAALRHRLRRWGHVRVAANLPVDSSGHFDQVAHGVTLQGTLSQSRLRGDRDAAGAAEDATAACWPSPRRPRTEPAGRRGDDGRGAQPAGRRRPCPTSASAASAERR